MYGELVYRNIVRRVLGVRPPLDSPLGRVQNILGVGPSKVGGEGDVEAVVDGGLFGGGREDRGAVDGLMLGRHRRHVHVVGVWPRHAKARSHPV